MYGFDTAGSLAEETANPRRNAPRAILQALGAAGVLGFLLLLGALMAAPDLTAAGLGRIDGGLRPSCMPRWEARSACCCSAPSSSPSSSARSRSTPARFVWCSRWPATSCCRSRERWLRCRPSRKRRSLPVLVIGAAAMAILVANINLPKLVELVTMIAVLVGQPGLPDRRPPHCCDGAGRDGPSTELGQAGAPAGRDKGVFSLGRLRHSREPGRGPVELVHGGERRLAARGGLRRGLANALRADHPHGDPRRHCHRGVRISWRGGARRWSHRSQICDRTNS